MGYRNFSRFVRTLAVLGCFATWAGPAAAAFDPHEPEIFSENPASFPDPFENANRRIFSFNRRADRWILAPVTRAYGSVVPNPVKAGIRNLIANLGSPSSFVNDVLQGEWSDARDTVARFLVNTTVGVVGLVDAADRLGLPPQSSDFGETLAVWGVGSGPFLMVPLLGPTTVRDGFGQIVDVLLQPTTYFLVPGHVFVSSSIHAGSAGLAEREARDVDLRRLEEGSVDFYAALRSAYSQQRIAQIQS